MGPGVLHSQLHGQPKSKTPVFNSKQRMSSGLVACQSDEMITKPLDYNPPFVTLLLLQRTNTCCYIDF